MKTLYISDLDGTLLNTEDRISEYTRNTINNLVDRGMVFTYATARSLSSASIVTEGLKLKLPVIVYNGAFTREPENGKTISSNFFIDSEKQFVIDLLTKNRIYPLVYGYIDGIERVSWLQDKENDGFKRYLGNRRGDKRLNPLSVESDLYKGDVFYFTCIGEKEELLPVYNSLRNNPDYNCILQQELYREEYWCEIMHKQSTKANAASRLKKMLNCDRIVSFGDAINDIPMFSISDESYAVANSVSELKDMSTGIIGNNNENGVARWLEEIHN